MVKPAGTIVVADMPVFLCVFTHTKPLSLYLVPDIKSTSGVVDSR